MRTTVALLLRDDGMRVRAAASGTDALQMLAEDTDCDVVLLDRSMPDAPGEAFVSRIRELSPRARILFFSGQTIDAKLEALVDGLVLKPVGQDDLLAAIRTAAAGAKHSRATAVPR